MLGTVVALASRIVSNPLANVFQKKLVKTHSAILINFYCYLFLSLFCFPFALNINWSVYGLNYWWYVLGAGILCTLGNICLIKALQSGEMSILGPINSYKCLVGLAFGWLFLNEIPSLFGFLGMLLVIWGSWYIFDTVDDGLSFKLFLRKDIILRFCALFFSGCEAAVLKKIILLSTPEQSFVLWCFTGLLFSFILMILFRKKFEVLGRSDLGKCLMVAFCFGIMQLSTNFVFLKLNVGLSLALFQLSTIVSVLFGYKFFHEDNLPKKIIGSVIMIGGSCLILLL